MLRVVLITLGLGIAALVGYAFYSHKKLGPTMDSPVLRVPVSVQNPTEITWEVRDVDTGYARFALPAFLNGELLRHRNLPILLIAAADSEKKPGPGYMMDPISERSGGWEQIRISYERLSGESVPNPFALKKRAFETKPFSVWAMLVRGPKRASADARLLAIRLVASPFPCEEVQIAEDEKVGFIISISDKSTQSVSLDIHDKRSGTFQTMGFDGKLTRREIEQIWSSVFHTYKFTLADASEGAVKAAITQRDFKVHHETPPPPPKPKPDDMSDPGLEKAAKAVRERRARRTAEQQRSLVDPIR